MYAFVDRPVENLCNSGRFLLWAMRGWTHAAGCGSCPPQALRHGFAGVRALAALPDFHVAMALVASDALETLDLAPMACSRIAEDEAILLGVWRDLSRDGPSAAHATLALLVDPDSVMPVAQAMAAALTRLTDAGFDFTNLSPHMKHQDN